MKKVRSVLIFNASLLALGFVSIIPTTKVQGSYSSASTINSAIAQPVLFSSNRINEYKLTSLTKDDNCHQFTISKYGYDFISTKHCSVSSTQQDLVSLDRPYIESKKQELEFPKPQLGRATINIIVDYKEVSVPIEITEVDSCIAKYNVVDPAKDVRQGDSGAPVTDEAGSVIAINFAIDKNHSTTVANEPSIKKSSQGYAIYRKCN